MPAGGPKDFLAEPTLLTQKIRGSDRSRDMDKNYKVETVSFVMGDMFKGVVVRGWGKYIWPLGLGGENKAVTVLKSQEQFFYCCATKCNLGSLCLGIGSGLIWG